MLKSWKDHYWAGVPVMRARIEETVREVNGRGKKVLEIGCNEGFLSKALLEDGCLVTSADNDPACLAKAKETFGIEGILADINSLPFEDNSFDIAVSGETLEHTQFPFKALHELFRVAREKVVVSLPIGEYWLGADQHQWELNGTFIEHDNGNQWRMSKHILVLSWTRRRTEKFEDIPPFSTKALKEKYKI
jgi:ubiquinone/menaquinone biosynthesis C-methylase UbiE